MWIEPLVKTGSLFLLIEIAILILYELVGRYIPEKVKNIIISIMVALAVLMVPFFICIAANLIVVALKSIWA